MDGCTRITNRRPLSSDFYTKNEKLQSHTSAKAATSSVITTQAKITEVFKNNLEKIIFNALIAISISSISASITNKDMKENEKGKIQLKIKSEEESREQIITDWNKKKIELSDRARIYR